MKLTQWTLLIGVLAMASGCTSSGSGGTGARNNNNTGDASTPNTGDAAVPAHPSAATQHIDAATGGTVTLSDGAAVTVPAGALNASADISITSAQPATNLPDRATIHGLTYDLKPNGTTFNDPVTLTLPLTGTPGANEQAVVSWLNTDTNQWEDLSTASGNGKVSAAPTHFTLFAVRFAADLDATADAG